MIFNKGYVVNVTCLNEKVSHNIIVTNILFVVYH